MALSEGGMSFTGFTRLSKGLAAVFVLGFAVSCLFPWSVEYLALVPGRTIPFAWNVVTSSYFEHTFLGLITSVVGILYFGKLLEPIWGPRAFIKFIAFVSFFTSISTFVVSICFYYITSQGRYLYLPISGFSGVLAGLLVGIKQLMPDLEFQPIKLRAKWFPSVIVALAVIAGMFVTDAIMFVPYITLGTYIGWLYLRYFQPKSEAKHVKGDMSDEFAFSTFFHSFMRPIVNPLSGFCEKLFCGRRAQSGLTEDEEQAAESRPLPGSDPIEASRRRERGARALEERLTASNDNSIVETLPTTAELNV